MLLSFLTALLSFSTATTAAGFAQNGTVCGRPFPSLLHVDLEQLQEGLTIHQFTSSELVTAYIDRIHEVNDTLNVVTEINPDALQIAKQLDRERALGKIRGPLHGIPILIKGNIATLDKMSTTAGSFALYGARPPRDATVAAKLRKAGAIILGKTNLSQWANFRSNNSTNGWSAYGGQCFGAYYPEQDPSGSSSGSGVGASIGLALAALGTETSGSIISPSEVNNLVGIKPTVGLTSRALVVPISQRQDTVGPMARTVKDAAYLLQAIAGSDPADNYTSASPFGKSKLPDYVAACNYNGLVGKRIGIPRNLIPDGSITDAQASAFENSIEVIRKAGAIIVDNTNATSYAAEVLSGGYLGNLSLTILGADFVSDLPGEYLSKLATNPHGITNLEQTRQFTQTFPAEDYPDRDTGVWDFSLDLGFNNTSPEFWPLYQLNIEVAGRQGILGALKNHSLDALILPSALGPNAPAIVGTPLITVPMGSFPANTSIVRDSSRNELVEIGPNIPFGLSFLGPAWSEAELISYAYAYEQRTHVREKVQPYLVPKTELWDVVKP